MCCTQSRCSARSIDARSRRLRRVRPYRRMDEAMSMNTFTKVLLKPLSRAARPYVRSVGLLQVSSVYNRSALVWEPGAETVLALAPHMDDETMGCGGTLALHAQRGATVTVAFLTDGRN